MALGFEQAGFDVLAAVDLDPVHLAAHERNFPLCEPLCADVAELTGVDLRDAAQRGFKRRYNRSARVAIDCVFGGPSCQGFSVIGPRQVHDPRNALVAQFARIVAELQPRFFVMENVPGLVSPAYSVVLATLYRTLERAGYCVAPPWTLNAANHGVPQERKRVFIVGAKGGETLPTTPMTSSERVSVGAALGDLPVFEDFPSLYEHDELNLTCEQLASMKAAQSAYVRGINGAEDWSVEFADPRRSDPHVLSSVALTRHSAEVRARFARLAPGERDAIARLPRLDPDRQAPTLRAGTGRDHGSFTSARPVHFRGSRVITVREAARLHGFPDWFGFHVTKWHGFRQVGNAVPPPLARAVAGQVAMVAGATPVRTGATSLEPRDHLLHMSLEQAAHYYGLDAARLPVNVRAHGNGVRRAAA